MAQLEDITFMAQNSTGTNCDLMPNKQITNYCPVTIHPFFYLQNFSGHRAAWQLSVTKFWPKC